MRKVSILLIGMMCSMVLGGGVMISHVVFTPVTKLERGGADVLVMDLMLPADELPNEWKSLEIHEYQYIRYIERPEIKAYNSLQYNPTGGPATIRIYKDPNRTAFNEEMGWARDEDSAIQQILYDDVPIFKYKTWMGYPRYLTHIDGYTFIFDAGIYGTDSYQSSGAPEKDTDKLFKAVITHALSRNLRVSEIEMPEPKKENFTISVVPVETISLRITYEEEDRRIVPTGYLEWGTLKVLNEGDKELKNIALELVPKKELTPGEIDIIKHTPEKQIEEQDIQLVQNVTINLDVIFIEELKPNEAREFPIEITIQGEGNYFGIEVIYENASIWGMQGFVRE